MGKEKCIRSKRFVSTIDEHRGIQTEGAKENIWTKEGGSGGSLEKTA
jgi:hypothetical protein